MSFNKRVSHLMPIDSHDLDRDSERHQNPYGLRSLITLACNRTLTSYPLRLNLASDFWRTIQGYEGLHFWARKLLQRGTRKPLKPALTEETG